VIASKILSTVFIACTFWGGFAMSSSAKTKTVENGAVTTKTTTIPAESLPQTIAPVSSEFLAGIDALAAQGNSFVASYFPKVENPTLKDFDAAFQRWQKEKKRRYTDQEVLGILGAYLGNKLVADFQMQWVEVTDQYGTDYAVRQKNKASKVPDNAVVEVMTFPFSSVTKRIQSNEHDFLVGVYFTVQQAMVKADNDAK
jgi:Domain of unknown function (DUF3806)